ncbi:MAG: Gfo/Idh/MocA family oxidoreductase [Chloroflexota bacterium]
MADRVRIGVIGVGMIGELHARFVAQRIGEAELVAVADADTARAAAVAGALGGATVHADGPALIADPHVAAVLIASPDGTHADLTRACLAAGKPVLCEKPLATSVAAAWEVVTAERATGRRLIQLGFMREFDPPHAAVRAAVAADRLGDVVLVRSVHVNRDRGGRQPTYAETIVNSIIHDIHSARFLSGREIVEVDARSVPYAPDAPETCRFLTISCTLDDGSLALLDVNCESGYGYRVWAEVVGTRASATTADPAPAILAADGVLGSAVPPGFRERFEEAYFLQDAAWVRSLVTGVPVGPSAWDGYAALAVADAAIASVREGRRVRVEMRDRPS